MFFAFVEELLFHAVFAFLDVLADLELLGSKLVLDVRAPLEKVFGHGVIFLLDEYLIKG